MAVKRATRFCVECEAAGTVKIITRTRRTKERVNTTYVHRCTACGYEREVTEP